MTTRLVGVGASSTHLPTPQEGRPGEWTACHLNAGRRVPGTIQASRMKRLPSLINQRLSKVPVVSRGFSTAGGGRKTTDHTSAAIPTPTLSQKVLAREGKKDVIPACVPTSSRIPVETLNSTFYFWTAHPCSLSMPLNFSIRFPSTFAISPWRLACEAKQSYGREKKRETGR